VEGPNALLMDLRLYDRMGFDIVLRRPISHVTFVYLLMLYIRSSYTLPTLIVCSISDSLKILLSGTLFGVSEILSEIYCLGLT
jgi:hypothetical protein